MKSSKVLEISEHNSQALESTSRINCGQLGYGKVMAWHEIWSIWITEMDISPKFTLAYKLLWGYDEGQSIIGQVN